MSSPTAAPSYASEGVATPFSNDGIVRPHISNLVNDHLDVDVKPSHVQLASAIQAHPLMPAPEQLDLDVKPSSVQLAAALKSYRCERGMAERLDVKPLSPELIASRAANGAYIRRFIGNGRHMQALRSIGSNPVRSPVRRIRFVGRSLSLNAGVIRIRIVGKGIRTKTSEASQLPQQAAIVRTRSGRIVRRNKRYDE
jgi:hypothetical protein